MNSLCLQDLLDIIESYNEDEIEKVKYAYCFAEKFHKNQKRQSGEAYIIHPLNVAYTLANMKADGATVCAGLLHDVLEDTVVTEDELICEFGEEVCMLVNGVTKISNIHFMKSEDIIMENTRKIITSLKSDVRIIIIKLADRLHNMQTLDFKEKIKRIKNAKETMEIFVPIAYHIGAYEIKTELEDLSLKYLDEESYHKIVRLKEKHYLVNGIFIEKMKYNLNKELKESCISNEIFIRNLSITGVQKRLNKGYDFNEIHNVVSLVINTNLVDNCYKILGKIHKLYNPVNHKFKDYICNSKTNMYRSLHTTVFGENETLVQIQIRTFEMDLVDRFGLISYFETDKARAKYLMKEQLTNKYQFFKSLVDLDDAFGDNYQFVNLVKDEILNDKIYVYSPLGKVVELPKGSTPIDFAFKIHTEIGNKIVSALVNDCPIDLDYMLKNKDRVRIITDDSDFDRANLEEKAYTNYAKRKIREYLKKEEDN